jgi:hypothetical protein
LAITLLEFRSPLATPHKPKIVAVAVNRKCQPPGL